MPPAWQLGRSRRTAAAAAAVAAVLAIGGVVSGLARFPGSDDRASPSAEHRTSAPGPVAPSPQRAEPALAPQLSFSGDGHAYLVYDACQPGRCLPRIYASADDGRTWSALRRPEGVLGPSVHVVAAGRLVAVVDRAGRGVMSADAGAHWRPVPVAGATSARPRLLVRQEDGRTVTLDPTTGTAALVRLGAPVRDGPVGILPGGEWWAVQGRLLISVDAGRTWRADVPPQGNEQIEPPLQNTGGQIVEVAGGSGATVTPATRVLRSDDDGRSWRVTRLQGTRVSADCAVLLDDGRLLAPGVDRAGGLWQLLPGSASFTAAPGPGTDLDCLARSGATLWGLSRDGTHLLTAPAGDPRRWRSTLLPEQP